MNISDAIAALQFARVQIIDITVRAKQCETNLDAALSLLQEIVASQGRS